MTADAGYAWRELAAGDRALWIGLYTDAETMRQIAAPMTPEAAGRSFEVALEAVARGRGVHRVLVDPDGIAIGLGLLAPAASPGGAAEVEVGIVLRDAYRGRGLGRLGLGLLVDEAKARFGGRAISVQYRAEHVATAHMVAGLGFVEHRGHAPDGWVRALLARTPPSAGPAVDSQGTGT